MNPPSTTTKAYVGAVIAVCAAVGGTFADSALGKFCVILAAGLTAYLGVFKAKNTETVETGVGTTPTVTNVLGKTGQAVGTVVVDTGAATGGIVAGTTGGLGQVLDATLGKVLPAGSGKHS